MKAMILAAGLGTRMRPLTDHIPKPLLKIGNKTLIECHIENLAKAGIKKIIINHAYLGEKIEATLKDGSDYGVQIQYSREDTALETGGGILKALPLLIDQDEQDFIVVNSDIWTEYDFKELLKPMVGLAHLVLVQNPTYHPQGDFALVDNLVKNPTQNPTVCTFSGISVLNAKLFTEVDSGVKTFPLAPLLRKACDQNLVTGELYQGQWWDIGTPERLHMLNSFLSTKTDVK